MISKKDLLNRIYSLENQLRGTEKQLRECISDNRKGLATIRQLQCAAKGHNFVFEKRDTFISIKNPIEFFSREKIFEYQFKCTNCNLTITKTKDELTPKEIKALKDLRILEEDENGKSPTTKN